MAQVFFSLFLVVVKRLRKLQIEGAIHTQTSVTFAAPESMYEEQNANTQQTHLYNAQYVYNCFFSFVQRSRQSKNYVNLKWTSLMLTINRHRWQSHDTYHRIKRKKNDENSVIFVRWCHNIDAAIARRMWNKQKIDSFTTSKLIRDSLLKNWNSEKLLSNMTLMIDNVIFSSVNFHVWKIKIRGIGFSCWLD